MQVKLSKIRSAAQPVRTTQDEAKIIELMASIGEYGLLQAVEVRPAGDKYEIVFGNRRVEACRRLGHTHIEAVVQDLNDSTALIHGLIENVVREDLGPLDTARALKVLQDETGWSTRDIAAQGFMSAMKVSRMLALLREPEEVQRLLTDPLKEFRQSMTDPLKEFQQSMTDPLKDLLTNPLEGVTRCYTSKAAITPKHVQEVRREKLPEEQHIQVLQKAAEEGLTAQQARVEAQILKTYGTKEEILADAQRYIEQEKQDKEKSRWGYLADSPCAKNFIRHIKVNSQSLKRLWQDVERGALGIEHMPYVEKRLRKYAEFIIGLADDLKKRRKEAVGE